MSPFPRSGGFSSPHTRDSQRSWTAPSQNRRLVLSGFVPSIGYSYPIACTDAQNQTPNRGLNMHWSTRWESRWWTFYCHPASDNAVRMRKPKALLPTTTTLQVVVNLCVRPNHFAVLRLDGLFCVCVSFPPFGCNAFVCVALQLPYTCCVP